MKQLHKKTLVKRGRMAGVLSLPLLLAAMLSLLLLSSLGWSAAQTKAPASPAAKPEATTPQPEKILEQACEMLKGNKQFSFKAEVTDDRVYSRGLKLQYAFDLEAFVQRPDRLRVNAAGDMENKEFFYNGKSITLYDKAHNAYAVMEGPASIDEALDKAHKEYGLKIALSDLAAADPYARMTKGVKHALYVGQGLVRGVKCHHLAFDRDDFHWQIWVDAGEKPLIRKLVITQKKFAFSPQWTAWFTDWNFAPQLSDSLFAFTPPEKAAKIRFVSLKEAAAQQPKAAPAPKKPQTKEKGAAS